MAAPKYLRDIAALAVAQGWTVDTTEKGHPRFVPPAGTVDPKTGRPAVGVVFAKTPSDWRGLQNGIAQLRRLGLAVPHKGHTKGKGK